MEVPIFRAEAEIEGLAEKIRSNSSIAYYVPLQPMQLSEQSHLKATLENKAKATIGDLYPTKSILASTVWNKNDDVFDVVETWVARRTPVNKPSNIEHQENEIVGHMTETWAVDKNGVILADNLNVEDLPPLYHLCNGAVIYTHWQEPKLIERTQQLIEEIEAGKKYVSMECLFSNFDYALERDGGYEIRKRESSTAFLTKHLRVYGGTGEWDGQKVGRLIRNFVFSGKGYVNAPANPDSIIFNNPKMAGAAGVVYSFSSAHEEKNMADDNVLKDQLTELKDSLKEVTARNKELEKQLAEANVQGFEKKIEELTNTIEDTKNSAEAVEKERDELKKEMAEINEKLEEATKSNDELAKQVKKIEAEKVRAGRISTLVDGGISKENAEAKIDKFVNLSDEQFEDLADELIKAAKAVKTKEETNEANASEESDESEEAEAADEALEEAEEEEEVAASVGSDDSNAERENTRKAIANRFAQLLKVSVPEDDEE